MRIRFTEGTEAVIVAQPPAPCPGDVNGDHTVDFDDLIIVLAHYNETSPIGQNGDTTEDGVIDFNDVITVLANWGPCFPV